MFMMNRNIKVYEIKQVLDPVQKKMVSNQNIIYDNIKSRIYSETTFKFDKTVIGKISTNKLSCYTMVPDISVGAIIEDIDTGEKWTATSDSIDITGTGKLFLTEVEVYKE